MFNCWNRYFSTKFEQTTKPFLLLFLLGTSSLLKAFAQRDVDSEKSTILTQRAKKRVLMMVNPNKKKLKQILLAFRPFLFIFHNKI